VYVITYVMYILSWFFLVIGGTLGGYHVWLLRRNLTTIDHIEMAGRVRVCVVCVCVCMW